MQPLHKRRKAKEQFDSSDGEQNLLCSNKGACCSPSLGFNPNSPLLTDEFLVDYLAEILVEGIIENIIHERAKKEGRNIL